MDLLELFFRDGEWARTIVSLVVGALLGGAASMLVQMQSNRAARERQVRAEQALHAADLLALLRQRGPLGYQDSSYVLHGVKQFDLEIPFKDLQHRLALWSNKPDRFISLMDEVSGVFASFRNRDDPTGEASLSPDVFRNEHALSRYKKIAGPIDEAFKSDVEAAIVRFPLHGEKTFIAEVETAISRARDDFRKSAVGWEFYTQRRSSTVVAPT